MEYPKESFRRIWFKFTRVPYFLWDALTYPPRRRQVCWRLVEVLVGLLVVFYLPTWQGVLAGLASEFLVYEFLLEPLGLAGYYWERGPRGGDSPGGITDGYWAE